MEHQRSSPAADTSLSTTQDVQVSLCHVPAALTKTGQASKSHPASFSVLGLAESRLRVRCAASRCRALPPGMRKCQARWGLAQWSSRQGMPAPTMLRRRRQQMRGASPRRLLAPLWGPPAGSRLAPRCSAAPLEAAPPAWVRLCQCGPRHHAWHCELSVKRLRQRKHPSSCISGQELVI